MKGNEGPKRPKWKEMKAQKAKMKRKTRPKKQKWKEHKAKKAKNRKIEVGLALLNSLCGTLGKRTVFGNLWGGTPEASHQKQNERKWRPKMPKWKEKKAQKSQNEKKWRPKRPKWKEMKAQKAKMKGNEGPKGQNEENESPKGQNERKTWSTKVETSEGCHNPDLRL